MKVLKAPIRIIGFGGYGASVLAQLWLNDDTRSRLEKSGPVVWQVMESSTGDIFKNKDLSQALLSGADVEIELQTDVLALHENAHVLIGLGGSGAQSLIESLTKSWQPRKYHIYACLPYEFDTEARARAKEELLLLQSLLGPEGENEHHLDVIDRADFVQGSMLESMERIKNQMINALLVSTIGAKNISMANF